MPCNIASCGFDSGTSGASNFDFALSDCYEQSRQVACYDDKGYPYTCSAHPQFGKDFCLEEFSLELLGWDVGLCAKNCER